MKKDFEDLAEEAIQNIRKDREQTHELLQDLKHDGNDFFVSGIESG